MEGDPPWSGIREVWDAFMRHEANGIAKLTDLVHATGVTEGDVKACLGALIREKIIAPSDDNTYSLTSKGFVFARKAEWKAEVKMLPVITR